MRVQVPIVIIAVAAVLQAVAQYLVVIGKFQWERWPLLRNPSRALRLAYAAGSLVFGAVALGIALMS